MSSFTPAYQYRAQVIRVVDGDTIVVQVDLGFKTFVEKILRLARINAPEKSTPEGIVAQAYLNKYLLVENNGAIHFTSKKLDIYGRSIAEVQIDKEGEAFVSDLVVSNGQGVYRKY
jgi:micrococcal nuclease